MIPPSLLLPVLRLKRRSQRNRLPLAACHLEDETAMVLPPLALRCTQCRCTQRAVVPNAVVPNAVVPNAPLYPTPLYPTPLYPTPLYSTHPPRPARCGCRHCIRSALRTQDPQQIYPALVIRFIKLRRNYQDIHIAIGPGLAVRMGTKKSRYGYSPKRVPPSRNA